MANNNNSTSNMTEEEKIAWYKNVFYPRMIAEYNSNKASISEYSSFKTALSSLITSLESYKAYIKNTREAVLNAISFSGFEASIEKLNEYANSVESSITSISSVISEVDKKIKELEQRNNEIRAQIGI